MRNRNIAGERENLCDSGVVRITVLAEGDCAAAEYKHQKGSLGSLSNITP